MGSDGERSVGNEVWGNQEWGGIGKDDDEMLAESAFS